MSLLMRSLLLLSIAIFCLSSFTSAYVIPLGGEDFNDEGNELYQYMETARPKRLHTISILRHPRLFRNEFTKKLEDVRKQ